jgi:hypothetical protein
MVGLSSFGGGDVRNPAHRWRGGLNGGSRLDLSRIMCYNSSRRDVDIEGTEMTVLEEFSKGLEGKDLDELIHEAKAESESRILGQGIACLALFISEVMMEAVAASREDEHRYKE